MKITTTPALGVRGGADAQGRHEPLGTADPSDTPLDSSGWSLRHASATAGAGLVLMIVPAFFGNFVAVEGLVTRHDAVRTAADISASVGLFRFGVASLFAVVLLDLVVAVALYHVFRPVSEGASMLAATARLVYAGVFMVAISHLAGVAALLGNPASVAVLGQEQVQAQAWLGVESFLDTWSAGLLLFGLHLLVISWLAWRSRYVPKVLAALLALAGVGYAFDSMAAVLVGHGAPSIAEFTFLGEVLLAVWLIIWSRRLPRGRNIAT